MKCMTCKQKIEPTAWHDTIKIGPLGTIYNCKTCYNKTLQGMITRKEELNKEYEHDRND